MEEGAGKRCSESGVDHVVWPMYTHDVDTSADSNCAAKLNYSALVLAQVSFMFCNQFVMSLASCEMVAIWNSFITFQEHFECVCDGI